MIQLLIGSLMLSLIHAVIPNHWLPIVAIGKSERWSRRETLWVTAIAGSAHTLSTILIGIVVGLVGYKLSSTQELTTRIVAPLILVVLGAIYLLLGMRGAHHHHDLPNPSEAARKSKWTVVVSLSVAMLFSPCLEIDAYFFNAGIYGGYGIAVVSLIYMIVTVLGMLLLVEFGRRGMEKIKWHFLETRERSITGATLIVLGIAAFYIHR